MPEVNYALMVLCVAVTAGFPVHLLAGAGVW